VGGGGGAQGAEGKELMHLNCAAAKGCLVCARGGGCEVVYGMTGGVGEEWVGK